MPLHLLRVCGSDCHLLVPSPNMSTLCVFPMPPTLFLLTLGLPNILVLNRDVGSQSCLKSTQTVRQEQKAKAKMELQLEQTPVIS